VSRRWKPDTKQRLPARQEEKARAVEEDKKIKETKNLEAKRPPQKIGTSAPSSF
jgi:hypothetical protein